MDAYVQLTGNVGGAVEFRNKGVPIASFRLAHTPRVRRQGEWVDAPTTWITVTCFRSLAENVASSLQTGQPVIVAGRLRTNVWGKEGVTYERLILEAITVGHDLTWGSAVYHRNERPGSGAEDPQDVVGEMVDRLASQGVDQPGGELEPGSVAEPRPDDVDADGVVRAEEAATQAA